ncbi:MAG: hypothetical protein R3B45_13020 [Bdellovibrionota bacterium]
MNNASNKFEIVTTEITLNSDESASDSKSTTVIIRDVEAGDPAAPMIKLATDFYEDGNWMAVFYRVYNTSNIYIHGYHVSSK